MLTNRNLAIVGLGAATVGGLLLWANMTPPRGPASSGGEASRGQGTASRSHYCHAKQFAASSHQTRLPLIGQLSRMPPRAV